MAAGSIAKESVKLVNRPAIFSWCLYDWANSAFSTVIGTFIFSVYFAKGIFGDATGGSVVWGYAIGGAGLVVALLGPVVGAIADHSGRQKSWVAVATAVTVLATAALFFAEPDRQFVILTLALVAIATIAFEFSTVFYNATLHQVAPPDMLGRVSGWGWALGYFGGLGCLAVGLVALVQPDVPWFGFAKEGAENIRATGPLVAIWFSLFALPFFLFVPGHAGKTVSTASAIRAGLRQLRDTVREIGFYRPIVLFLIASALYRDGLATLFALGGLYAAGVYGMNFEEIMLFAIALNISAGLGAFVFAWMDDRAGSKETVLAALAGLLVFGTAILFTNDWIWFTALAIGLGIFVGPAQAASRSLMARLSPDGMETEMFGLYALTGKSVAFLGPIFYAAATDAFDSQRAGLVTILAVWALGGLLLLGVRTDQASSGGSDASR